MKSDFDSHNQSMQSGSIISLRLVCSMETTFRHLQADEMRLLEKLLDHEFPGRDALRVQLSSVTARQIDENGSLGGKIAVLLHVKNGRMRLLEVLKEDGSAILRAPTADALSSY